MRFIPWLLALLTAGWFALEARRAGRNPFSWALSGAVFGLVAATIVLGLGKATGNPFSDQQLHLFRLKWAAEAVATIAVLGWFITLPLHRQHLALWRRVTQQPAPPAPTPPPSEPKPKAEAAKQPAKS